MVTRFSTGPIGPLWTTGLLALVLTTVARPLPAQTFPAAPNNARGAAPGLPSGPPSIIHKVQAASDRIEMTVHTSRILTTELKIPQAQVNNPSIVELTPLSPTEIQVSAKSAGVTQINLWDEQNRVTTIDVIVYGDAQELNMLLRNQFPNAALRVVPVGNGVLISGYVDQPEHVDLIVRIAEEYYPKVINAMTVGGVQQVLLHVKVMEVSRTKLRRLGVDFAKITGNNVVTSGISGLLRSTVGNAGTTIASSGGQTFAFSVLDGTAAFFGLLDALRQDNLAKVLSEPTLVTVSGRPAYFNVGGEIPIPVPQSLGTISIEYKKYGTQLDFVPIVLGNGNIRLEVRPRVSEIDPSRSVTVASTTVPGLRTREAETGVEMKAGQTLAIAGLVQVRTEAVNRGLPWISDVPYLGVPFRRVSEETNEIELLILVTPELAEAMDAHQVPPCGPGTTTTSPTDWELYMLGHVEVPACCPGPGGACGACGGGGATACQGGAAPCDPAMAPGMILAPGEQIETPLPADSAGRPGAAAWPRSVTRQASTTQPRWGQAASGGATATATAVMGPVRAPAAPPVSQNRQTPSIPQPPPAPRSGSTPGAAPTFVGPFGYDLVN